MDGKDLLIIPAFNRPEMLQLCLESLVQTGELGQFEIWVCVDDHRAVRYDPDVAKPLDWLLREHRIPVTVKLRKVSDTYGNSRNIMEAYKEAFHTSARFVFMAEDDILVTQDFFRWCYETHLDHPLDCVVATRPERGIPIEQKAGFYVDSDFASGAVCWKRSSLGSVVDHANPSFYNRLAEYCDEHYPESLLRGCYGEQDGLIRRICEDEQLKVAWPWYSRARHIGIYGFHDTIPRGNYLDRLAYLRSILSDQTQLDKWRKDCDAVKL